MPEMPMLIHDFLKANKDALQSQLPETAGGTVSSKSSSQFGIGNYHSSDNKSLRFVIAGAAVLVTSGLWAAASVIASAGNVSGWVYFSGVVGILLIGRGLLR